MASAYIALGSNLGDRERYLRDALERLAALGTVVAVSPFLDTAPVGKTDQPRFLNAVAQLDTDLTPDDLLRELLAIEAALGRVRAERWGPRSIDLDLLLYDDLVRDEPGLTVPHPRLHERRFVLEPLAAIAPTLRHPVLGRTVRELLDGLMAIEQHAARYSVAEYLAFEARAHERHEYHAGYVYAMAGGTAAHSAIGAQVIADLVRQLAGGTCRVHTSDMLIQQGLADLSYADAAVSCDPRDRNPQATIIHHPRLVVEVLSASTAPYDLTTKLALWQAMESMEYIVYIDARLIAPLQLWTRRDGQWARTVHERDQGPIALAALHVSLDLVSLYAASGLADT